MFSIDHLLPERPGHAARPDAADGVGGAAGAERHDHADRRVPASSLRRCRSEGREREIVANAMPRKRADKREAWLSS